MASTIVEHSHLLEVAQCLIDAVTAKWEYPFFSDGDQKIRVAHRAVRSDLPIGSQRVNPRVTGQVGADRCLVASYGRTADRYECVCGGVVGRLGV